MSDGARPRLRVATYNVYLGADLSLMFGVVDAEGLLRQARVVRDQLAATDFPARAEAIARLLVREEVDVVGLQEVARWSVAATSEGADAPGESVVWLDFLDELGAALARVGAPYDAYACNANFRGSAAVSGSEVMSVLGHNVVLVRRDRGIVVEDARTGGFDSALDITTGMEGLTFNVARGWGWVDLRVGSPGAGAGAGGAGGGAVAGAGGSARLRFVNTHTEAYDELTRNAQRDELVAVVGEPGFPVVVAGDFNAVPERIGMPAPYVDAWVAGRGEGRGMTSGQAAELGNDDSALGVRIDYLWVRDAAVEACWVVGDRPEDRATHRETGARLWPSDHACVIADVLL